MFQEARQGSRKETSTKYSISLSKREGIKTGSPLRKEESRATESACGRGFCCVKNVAENILVNILYTQ